jgi:hypothetical protein
MAHLHTLHIRPQVYVDLQEAYSITVPIRSKARNDDDDADAEGERR